MQRKKTDRRVKYTVMVLKDALVSLMQKEHISKISVKSICELADVNRSTFYAHFNDQYSLLHSIEQEAIDNVKKHLAKQDFNSSLPISFQALNRILEYVQSNAALFLALLGDNCDSSIQSEIVTLAQVFADPLYEDSAERIRDYLAVFGTTGCVSILQKWLEDGTPEPPARISELILQVLYQGITGFRQLQQSSGGQGV